MDFHGLHCRARQRLGKSVVRDRAFLDRKNHPRRQIRVIIKIRLERYVLRRRRSAKGSTGIPRHHRPSFISNIETGGWEVRFACSMYESSHRRRLAVAECQSSSNRMYLFVCPDLFEVPYEFPTLGECPSIAPGRFDVPYGNPTRLSYNRLMMTINTLARKYVPNVVPDNKKIFDINDCFNARRNYQLNNGFNYAYYAACKSSLYLHSPTFPYP